MRIIANYWRYTLQTITVIGISCMLGVYSTYPHRMRAHVEKADMLLIC